MFMQFIPIKTRVLNPPKDDLYKVLDESIASLEEGDIILITSKVLSIHQGQCVLRTEAISKDELIMREADEYIPRNKCPAGNVILTIKQNTLIPSSGIDESNANGYFILWPKNINESAKEIAEYIKSRHAVKNLAVIITDSHTLPLRYGVTGIAIGFWGLVPLRDYRGKKDIFGRVLAITQTNIVDSIAAASSVIMGEGNEQVPIVIVRGAPGIQFTNENKYQDFIIPESEDIYKPLLDVFRG